MRICNYSASGGKFFMYGIAFPGTETGTDYDDWTKSECYVAGLVL